MNVNNPNGLQDVQIMALIYSSTFQAPSRSELDEIKPNDSVKICCNCERFWVTVTSVNENIVIGNVDNHLLDVSIGARYGDSIRFEKNHIYSVYVS